MECAALCAVRAAVRLERGSWRLAKCNLCSVRAETARTAGETPALPITRPASFLWQFHELDCGAVGIADVNHTFSSIRPSAERLRFAGCFPARSRDFSQDSVKIIDRQRDVDRPDIARAKIDMLFPIGRREIFE